MSGSYSSFIELAKSGKHPFPEEHIKALIESMHRCGETIDNTEPNKFDKTSYYKKLFKKLEIKEECY
jgi:rRNA maturation protein Nop10